MLTSTPVYGVEGEQSSWWSKLSKLSNTGAWRGPSDPWSLPPVDPKSVPQSRGPPPEVNEWEVESGEEMEGVERLHVDVAMTGMS